MKKTLLVLLGMAIAGASSTALAWGPDSQDPNWPLAALGRRCADLDPAARASINLFCDARGRVAGIRMPVDVLHVPARQTSLLEWTDPNNPRQGSLRVEAHRGVLIVRRVTCGSCRRVMGDAYVVRIADMTDADLARIQQWLGLPPAPSLRTTAAWDRALDRAYPRP